MAGIPLCKPERGLHWQSVCSVITLRAADSVFVWFTKST